MDRMYGVYLDKDGMMFGSKRFDVDKVSMVCDMSIHPVFTS